LDLLLKKLLQSSKSGIELLLACTGAVVEISAAAAAETLAVLSAQQLGIQIQDENRPYNIIQIGAVSLQREDPFIFVLFVGHFRYQNHFDGKETSRSKFAAQRSQMPWMQVETSPVIIRTPAVFFTTPSAKTGSDTG